MALAIVSRNSPELQSQRHRDWLTTTGPGTRCVRVCLSQFQIDSCRLDNKTSKNILWPIQIPSRLLRPMPNELVAGIHDRMPLILAPGDYVRWLNDEPDPHELMRPFPAEPMRMWPISTRVNKPENDDPSIVEPIELATSAA